MIRQLVKKMIPQQLHNVAGDMWDAIGRTGSDISAALHPVRRDTIQKLGQLKDIHKGQRCFIIGNGPSLQRTDLKKLRGEYSLGMNRIYLAFAEMGFETNYYLSVNDLVVEQCADDISALKIPRFVSWRARQWLEPQDNLYFLYSTYTGPIFGADIRKRMWEGATVTYMALQVAYFLGFEEVILIGVDHNFVTQGAPNTTVVSEGDDPNHFHPGYFGKGFRWQLPDLETSEKAYRIANEAYIKAGRYVVDATIGGKLTVFPKIDYESIF